MSASLINAVGEDFTNATDWGKFFKLDEQKKIRKLEQRELPTLGSPKTSCDTNLFFGFFFDGTRNNYKKAEATGEHSNVARLYDIFPGQGVRGVVPDSAA
jgi:hypothetical protein